jgi:hypothetical protein
VSLQQATVEETSELYRRLIAARAALENEFAQAENKRGELVPVSAKVLEKLIDRPLR